MLEKLPIEPYVNSLMREALSAWGVNPKDLKEKMEKSLREETVEAVKKCLRKNTYEPLSDEAEEIAKVTRAYVAGMFSPNSKSVRKKAN